MPGAHNNNTDSGGNSPEIDLVMIILLHMPDLCLRFASTCTAYNNFSEVKKRKIEAVAKIIFHQDGAKNIENSMIFLNSPIDATLLQLNLILLSTSTTLHDQLQSKTDKEENTEKSINEKAVLGQMIFFTPRFKQFMNNKKSEHKQAILKECYRVFNSDCINMFKHFKDSDQLFVLYYECSREFGWPQSTIHGARATLRL